MPIPINPYITGEPVGHTDVFVGRKDILESVKNNLQTSQENVFLLYGQRRVGKTSILQYLEKQLKSENQFFPVYFSLHGKSEYTLVGVLQELAFTIANKLELADPRKELIMEPEQTFHKSWLPKVFRTLPEGNALVLLFDEFDVLADPSEKAAVDPESLPASHLFKYLKILATDYVQQLKLVFVIGRNKEDLSLVAQPLFRDALPSRLVSLLSPDDVATIVRLSEKNHTLFWTESAIGRIIQLTNGHPLFTQELCSQVWELLYDQNPIEPPTATDEDVDRVVPVVLDRISHHLLSFRENWSVEERVAAAALAEIGPSPVTQEQLENLLQEKSQLRIVIRQVQDATQRLRERDVFESVEGCFKFRVELVRQWINRYKKLDDVQSELDDVRSAAEELYRAASIFFRENKIEEAIEPARQAFETAPYRPEVTQLWADILIAQKKFAEAKELLEQFYEYEPTAASARLIKLYFLLAKESQGDDKRLEWYERVLAINPTQQEALKEFRAIWKFKAEVAERLAVGSNKLEDWEMAYAAYQKADLPDKAHELEQRIRLRVMSEGQQRLNELEREKKYPEALTLLDELEKKLANALWEEYRNRLTPKADLATHYQEAITALNKGEHRIAQTLLIKVIEQDPQYGEATAYLHQAVKGESFSSLHQRLADTQIQYTHIEAESQQLQTEVEQAQATISELNEMLTQANAEMQQLRTELESAGANVQREIKTHQQLEREIDAQRKQIGLLQEKMLKQEQNHKEELDKKEEVLQQRLEETEESWTKKYRQLEEEYGLCTQEKARLEKRIKKFDTDVKDLRDLLDEKQRTIRKQRAKLDWFQILLVALSVLFLLSVGYILFVP